uniref:Phytocyanin domain-containing protein n=1 Tax=Nelumbo nucifera TaxID=4432 RepID=A0A822YN86_NELNU|nr:TPA_asm: hypothetical protein HUJ06_009619 [Nelumbo nucifera]
MPHFMFSLGDPLHLKSELFELDRLGPFYFISGTEENCQKGEKMTVVVLSPKHHGTSSSAPAPAPTVAQEGPALTAGLPLAMLYILADRRLQSLGCSGLLHHRSSKCTQV